MVLCTDQIKPKLPGVLKLSFLSLLIHIHAVCSFKYFLPTYLGEIFFKLDEGEQG